MSLGRDQASVDEAASEIEYYMQHLPLAGRASAAFLALISCIVICLLCLAAYYMDPISYVDAIWEGFRQMAVIGAALLAITLFTVAITGRLSKANHVILASHLTALVMMSLIYHFYYANQGGFFFTEIIGYQLIHTLLVLLLFLWWAAFASVRALEYWDIPALGLWPAIYLAYLMWRGSLDGGYIYPFLDPTLLGREVVALVMIATVLGYCVVAGFIVLLTRFLAR